MQRHNRLDALVVAAAPSAQTLDASRHADPAQVLDAVDGKAMTFLRLANAALPIPWAATRTAAVVIRKRFMT